MIRRFNDETYVNGVRYEVACDDCGCELEDKWYGCRHRWMHSMQCYNCFFSLKSEIITEEHQAQKYEKCTCAKCFLEVEEGEMLYKDGQGYWYCKDCLLEEYTNDVDDTICDFKSWNEDYKD